MKMLLPRAILLLSLFTLSLEGAFAQGATSATLTTDASISSVPGEILLNSLHQFDAPVASRFTCKVALFGCVSAVGENTCGKLLVFARKSVRAGRRSVRFRASTPPVSGTVTDQRQINLQTRSLCRERGRPRSERTTIVSDSDAVNVTCTTGFSSSGRFVREYRKSLRTSTSVAVRSVRVAALQGRAPTCAGF